MDDNSPQARAAHFRSVADQLRRLANQLQYDIRRKDQILALADGFERFGERLEMDRASE
jgi:hypothetical protein